ncbi:MAG: FKBP-type peptidyl-prolyl cis-trans isomerase [Muribaculaceae bacterium]
MKKFIFGAAIALLVGAGTTSCGKDNAAKDAGDSLVSVETSDSISRAFGRYFGIQIRKEMLQYRQQTGESIDSAEFYKGMHSILAPKHSEAYIQGQGAAMNLMNQIMGLEASGVRVNRDALLNALRAELMADSAASDSVANKAFIEFNGHMSRIQEKARAREEAKKKEAPEAVQNRKTAEAYINKLKGSNPNFKVAESGLGYIITNPGEGNKPAANSDVVVSYTGTHLDGKTFDENPSANFNLAGVVPGFREALMMLAPGGEGTFYIPGSLAYGINGMPPAGIGPDEMLVFKVKLLEVAKPEVQAHEVKPVK